MLRCKQKSRVTFRPTLEVLEGRLTPTTNFHWVGGVAPDGSAWADGRNWQDDNGNFYSQGRYPGSVSDEDVAIFGYHPQDDCLYTGGAGNLDSISSDSNFDNMTVTLNANLAADNPSTLGGGTFVIGNNSTSTFSGQLVVKQNAKVSVGTGATLACNGDAAYAWNADNSPHTSLAVDGGASLLIDGGGTVQVAMDAFFPNGGILTFNPRGTTDAKFTGNGGKVWFDSGVLQSSTLRGQ
jgi:hypothetical protein